MDTMGFIIDSVIFIMAFIIIETVANDYFHNEFYYSFPQSQTIREFDELFTSQAFGFRDANAYYTSASLHDKMHSVAVPFLAINALDDPFQPEPGNVFMNPSV